MGAMWLGGGAAGGAWRARALDLLRVARGLAAACTSWDRYISRSSIFINHMDGNMDRKVYAGKNLRYFRPPEPTLSHIRYSPFALHAISI